MRVDSWYRASNAVCDDKSIVSMTAMNAIALPGRSISLDAGALTQSKIANVGGVPTIAMIASATANLAVLKSG